MNVLPSLEQATYDKVFRRVIPLLFTCYIVAFLDRVNVGFAKLQMAGDLHFSDAVYGFGAGIFFIGYFLFEVPSNVILSYAVTFWMPTLIQELGADPKDFLTVGLLSMIPWGVAAVCMVLVGSHSDRTGERRWHAAGSLGVAVVGLLALALVGHAAAPSIIALTLVTAGTLSWVVTFWSLPTAFLSGSAAAAGIAWINSVGNLGGHFGPDLIGRIRTATNSTEAAFFTLAAIGFVGVLIILLLPKTQSPK